MDPNGCSAGEERAVGAGILQGTRAERTVLLWLAAAVAEPGAGGVRAGRDEGGASEAAIEIVLTSGDRLRIGCDAASLRMVLSVLRERP